jgi:alanine racemase
VTSWIEISRERLAANFRTLVEAAGAETSVLAVVKANGYGHGAELCAVELARAGARWLGVGTASEGARVRTALYAAGLVGEDAPQILVMCGMLREDVAEMVQHRLTPVVWTAEQVGWLAGATMRAHVEVETGMGRQGVRPGAEMDELLDAMAGAGVELDGVMTHFCAAELADRSLTEAQQRRFEAAIAQVRARGLRSAWVHAGSSSSVDNPAAQEQGAGWLPELAKTVGAQPMVRCGIALYGYCLPIAGAGASSSHSKIRQTLQPVMTWKTRVIGVHEAAAGETFGYNATFTAPHAMRVALLPVGYADGLRRELSSTNTHAGGWVMLRSHDGIPQRAPILGRISMNLTTIDISGLDNLHVGDEVVLLGDGITADDHARLAGTIAYEILCGVRAG